MRAMSENKRIIINVVATIIATVTHACVGFFLSPFIVRTIGVEAQGFVQLATNFTSYAALVTVALNSMAGRFITIAVSCGDKVNAEKYYSSVFFGNIIFVAVLVVPVLVCIINLEYFIKIPVTLVSDVKLLFSFVFLSFFVSRLLSLWNNTFYITNRPYLQSLGNVISTLITAFFVFILFSCFSSKMYYSSLAGLVAMVFSICWSSVHKMRLLPSLRLKKEAISLKHIIEIVSSGVWRTIQSIGEMLLNGLDLLICNLMLSPVMMGVLALSKSLPMVLLNFCWNISTSFAPRLTIDYAKGNNKALVIELRKACKISAIINTVPIAALIVFGELFYHLWIPNQDSSVLQKLSILTCASLLLFSGIQPVANVFTTVNRVKSQALSVIIAGIANTLIVLVLLKLTDIGVYAIAGTSTAIILVRSVIYTLPTAARYLGLKWHTFFFGFKYSLLGSALVICIGFVVRSIINPDGWVSLVLSCAITGAIGFVLNTILMCNNVERKWIWAKLKTRIKL